MSLNSCKRGTLAEPTPINKHLKLSKQTGSSLAYSPSLTSCVITSQLRKKKRKEERQKERKEEKKKYFTLKLFNITLV